MMDPVLIGTIVAAAFSLAAAVYTARQGRVSAAETAAAADREVQRKMQVDLVTGLAEQVRELNQRVVELRTRLTQAETEVDEERRRRRELERTIERLNDTLDQLNAALTRFPAVLNDPEVRRFMSR